MELLSFVEHRKKSDIAKAKSGDKEAFLALVDQNRLNIYRVAKGILREEHDIEDAIQNTIIKAYKGIKTLKKDEFFRTWIIKILINECNSILRKNKNTVAMDEVEDSKRYEDSYENIDLINAIGSLGEELRIVISLYYFEDMSTVQIAKILDIPEGTVRSRLTRARGWLRKFMGEV